MLDKHKIEFPVIYGLDVRKEAEKIGAYLDTENGYFQPANFILRDEKVVQVTYSSDALGRLQAEHVLMLVDHYRNKHRSSRPLSSHPTRKPPETGPCAFQPFFEHLPPYPPTMRRGRYRLFGILLDGTKICKLQITEGSPMPSVEKDNIPFLFQIFGDGQLAIAQDRTAHARE